MFASGTIHGRGLGEGAGLDTEAPVSLRFTVVVVVFVRRDPVGCKVTETGFG